MITTALEAMPPEYQRRSPEFARKLRERRDRLIEFADRYYHLLARVVDVHGTDTADRAVIARVDDTHVDVTLRSGDAAPYFTRRFDARETEEIRVYLHGGDDNAVVRGNVKQSIVVRIIGGNGTNHLVDSSTVDGSTGTARLYDRGTVSNVTYGVDTIFDRRPFPRQGGAVRQPVHDYGGRIGPTGNLDINHDYGIEPELGLQKTAYGFGEYPYSSMIALDGTYSLKLTRYRLGLSFDKRFELSPLHVTGLARVSELELINFHGYGNQAPQSDTNFYIARQSQRLFQPAIALTLSPAAELSLSAVIQQSVTDTTRGHFVSDSQPYGYGTSGQFGEAGVQLRFSPGQSDDQKRHARHGNVVDLAARYFPGVWDVKSPFGSIEGLVAQYITFPIPTHPFLALRAGGTKVFGDFPFQEAAFLGGNTTIRTPLSAELCRRCRGVRDGGAPDSGGEVHGAGAAQYRLARHRGRGTGVREGCFPGRPALCVRRRILDRFSRADRRYPGDASRGWAADLDRVSAGGADSTTPVMHATRGEAAAHPWILRVAT